MQKALLLVLISIVPAIILFITVIGMIWYERAKKKNKFETLGEDDWLLSNWDKTIYNLLYKKSTSEKICGINRNEYNRMCAVIKEQPNFENIVSKRILAMVILLICSLLSILMMSSDTIMMIFFVLIGAIAFFVLWYIPFSNIKKKVEEKLFTVKNDLPRFLALLEKAMDLPVNQAMLVTASRFESPLSEDIIDSINKVSLGANGWQETLVGLAKIYEIEDFSDLVLEIVNSYEQGVNIRHLINRKAYEVEQNRMYTVEAHDAKIKTMIYLPIILFKVLPLMVMICIPMLSDLM